MSKYRKSLNSEWRNSGERGDFVKQVADATDGVRTYEDGAWRVVRKQADGTVKPAVRGKGGTVPFIGEMAWASAESLLSELYWKERNR